MKDGVEPEKGRDEFCKNNIGGMLLLYMEQFMAKDLLTFPAVEGQVVVPEYRPEEGEGRTGLAGDKELQPANSLKGVMF
jgi:hypothetical protein